MTEELVKRAEDYADYLDVTNGGGSRIIRGLLAENARLGGVVLSISKCLDGVSPIDNAWEILEAQRDSARRALTPPEKQGEA